MSRHLLLVIEDELSRPTLEEWFAAIRRRGPIRLRNMKGRTLVDILHEARRDEGAD